ncbi:AbrB/MazE/SpoVT family DNA-binding domain-containing protein [Nanoarchaeota archaeon]
MTIKRKVIQIAGSTCLVSLPKDWIKSMNVKKGDELDLQVENEKVVVSADSDSKPELIKVDVTDAELFVFRFLGAIYKSGYDEVEMRIGDNTSLKDLSRQINAMLPGYEIVDQHGSTCVIKNISKGLESEFDILLRKIFLITRTMANNTLEAIKTKEYSHLSDTLILEETTNRFCNFCERLLNKRGYKNTKKTTFVYNIVWELEKVADQFKYLNNYILEKKNIKISKETIVMFEKVNDLFSTFYELFYKFDQAKVQKIAEGRKTLVAESNRLFASRTTDPKIVHHLENVVQMVFNMTGSYLGTAF